MTTFSAGNGQFTPATTNDNFTLDATGNTYYMARVVMFGWGGSNASSNGYRTRWARPTQAATGAGTTLTWGAADPNFNTPLIKCFSTYATSQAVLPADPNGNLYATDWNNQGGTGVVALPLNNPWIIIGGVLIGQLSCRNTKGTDASLSSYNVYWDE